MRESENPFVKCEDLTRMALKVIQLEGKWGLPRKAGSALDRLVAQVEQMIVAGEPLAERVIWTLRMPSPQQLQLAKDTLAANPNIGTAGAATVQFVQGAQGLFDFLVVKLGL